MEQVWFPYDIDICKRRYLSLGLVWIVSREEAEGEEQSLYLTASERWSRRPSLIAKRELKPPWSEEHSASSFEDDSMTPGSLWTTHSGWSKQGNTSKQTQELWSQERHLEWSSIKQIHQYLSLEG
jgi:hypothetical protein